MSDKSRPQYSAATFARVEKAFYELATEYDPIGKIVFPMDICARAGISRGTWTYIARSAPWWDQYRKLAVLKESSKRGHIAQAKSHSCRGYSLEIFSCVEKIFQGLVAEYDPIGKPITVNDILSRIPISKSHMHNILRNAPWWDGERKLNALKYAHIKRHETLKKQGYDYSRLSISAKRKRYLHKPDRAWWGTHRIQGDNTRIRILELLNSSFPEEMSLREIAKKVGLKHSSSSSVLKHLRILRSQGIIDEHNRIINPDQEVSNGR